MRKIFETVKGVATLAKYARGGADKVKNSIMMYISFIPRSGGKDSCYSAMQCVAVGHTLAALANLLPEGKGQLIPRGSALGLDQMLFPAYFAFLLCSIFVPILLLTLV